MAKSKKLVLVIFIIIIIALSVFLFGLWHQKQTITFNKFGFSFDYPADLRIEEKGLSGYGKKASEKAGVILIGKESDLMSQKSKAIVDFNWRPLQDMNNRPPSKILDDIVKGIGKLGSIFQGDKLFLDHNGHKINMTRVCIDNKKGGQFTLDVLGAWDCENSNRFFLMRSVSLKSRLKFQTTFKVGESPKSGPVWPKLKKDHSYKAFKKVLDSFKCH